MFYVLYPYVTCLLNLPRIPSTQPVRRKQETELKIEAVRCYETLRELLPGATRLQFSLLLTTSCWFLRDLLFYPEDGGISYEN
jgi:hypothetical protein